MTLGSTYSAAKAAISDACLSLGYFLPEPPVDSINLTTEDGRAAWIADAEGTYENVVACGPNRLDLDEMYTLKIVFQSLPLDATDDTQQVTDERVDYMLGDFLTILADDPTFGLMDTFRLFEATHGSWQRYIGPITGTAIRPSRCDLDLNVRARISFT